MSMLMSVVPREQLESTAFSRQASGSFTFAASAGNVGGKTPVEHHTNCSMHGSNNQEDYHSNVVMGEYLK